MHRFALVCLFLLPALVSATPVILEGSYVTAVDDTSEVVPSDCVSVDVPSGLAGSCLVVFDLLVSPVGGTYLYASNQTYYHTMAGVTLALLNAAGDWLGNISLEGSSTGVNASAFSLSQSLLVESVPTSLELYFGGRDAQIDWNVTLYTATSTPLVRSAPAIPEPMTLMTLAMGSGFLALRKKLAA